MFDYPITAASLVGQLSAACIGLSDGVAEAEAARRHVIEMGQHGGRRRAGALLQLDREP